MLAVCIARNTWHFGACLQSVCQFETPHFTLLSRGLVHIAHLTSPPTSLSWFSYLTLFTAHHMSCYSVLSTSTRVHSFLEPQNPYTPSETLMSYSRRPNAQILELNGQPLIPDHLRLLRRTASGHLFDPASPTMLQSKNQPVEAMILDLNGDPIRRGEPHPLLRRTASGYLFQPPPSSVPECELQAARSGTPIALILTLLARWYRDV
jgi:hypothetical protein